MKILRSISALGLCFFSFQTCASSDLKKQLAVSAGTGFIVSAGFGVCKSVLGRLRGAPTGDLGDLQMRVQAVEAKIKNLGQSGGGESLTAGRSNDFEVKNNMAGIKRLSTLFGYVDKRIELLENTSAGSLNDEQKGTLKKLKEKSSDTLMDQLKALDKNLGVLSGDPTVQGGFVPVNSNEIGKLQKVIDGLKVQIKKIQSGSETLRQSMAEFNGGTRKELDGIQGELEKIKRRRGDILKDFNTVKVELGKFSTVLQTASERENRLRSLKKKFDGLELLAKQLKDFKEELDGKYLDSEVRLKILEKSQSSTSGLPEDEIGGLSDRVAALEERLGEVNVQSLGKAMKQLQERTKKQNKCLVKFGERIDAFGEGKSQGNVSVSKGASGQSELATEVETLRSKLENFESMQNVFQNKCSGYSGDLEDCRLDIDRLDKGQKALKEEAVRGLKSMVVLILTHLQEKDSFGNDEAKEVESWLGNNSNL